MGFTLAGMQLFFVRETSPFYIDDKKTRAKTRVDASVEKKGWRGGERARPGRMRDNTV